MKPLTPILLFLLLICSPGVALAQSLNVSSPTLVAQTDSPETIASSFISSLAQQQYSSALQDYDPTAQRNVTLQTLQQNWNDLVNANGAFQRIVRTELTENRGNEGESLVIVTCQFADATRDLFVVLRGSDVVGFSPAQ